MDKIEKLSGKKVPLHVTDLRDKVAVKKVSNFILLFRSFRVRKNAKDTNLLYILGVWRLQQLWEQSLLCHPLRCSEVCGRECGPAAALLSEQRDWLHQPSRGQDSHLMSPTDHHDVPGDGGGRGHEAGVLLLGHRVRPARIPAHRRGAPHPGLHQPLRQDKVLHGGDLQGWS